MKKIFTLFAALAMVMSMSAAPFLKGSFNGWGESNSLQSGSTDVTLNANATYEFKVNDGSNWYGNNGTMTSTNCTDWAMSTSGGNCKIKTTIAGVYTFKWNASSKKLSVVYPTEAVEINYYITGSGNLVGGDGWKANEIKMTNNDGTYTYTFTNLAAGNYEMKITQGNWDNTLGFSNLATSYVGVTGNNDNNIIMALADATNLTVTVTGTTVSLSLPEKTNTIYFVNEKGWAKVNAYVWTDNPYKPWPGEAMTKVEGKTYGGKDVYTYTYPANNSKVVFNDGGSNQTGDLTYSEATPYYYNGKWNASIAYDKAKYNVTVTAENGTVTGAGEYEEGKEATLTATPAEGYEFVNWTKGEEVVSTENPYKFTVTADVALVANFIKKTISYEMNGGAFPEVKVPTNEELALVFKQEYAEYFAIEGLTDTDMKREVGNFIYVTNSKGGDAIKFITENANWKWLHDYILTVAGNIPEGTNVGYYWRANLDGFFHCKNAVAVGGVASADYTVAGKPEAWGAAYQAAHAVVLPTEPVDAPYTLPTPVKEGYKFVGWYDNAEGTGEPMTVIPAGWDGTLYAIWVEIYTITVKAENGTVEGAGNYEHGAEATLTATAAEGYEFTCWTSGEDTVSTANPYKFTVTADVALVANFKKSVVTITKSFDLTPENVGNRFGRQTISVEDVDLGSVQLVIPGFSTEVTEYAEASLAIGDDEPLTATATYQNDTENNKEIYTAVATSTDGSKIYKFTFNVALPTTQNYELYAMGISATVESEEGLTTYYLKGNAILGEEYVPVEFMLDNSGYAEGTIGEVFAVGTGEAEQEGTSLSGVVLLEDESGNTYRIEFTAEVEQPEVEIVVKEEVNVALYNLTVDVQGTMAMVSAGTEELSFWLTLLQTENHYGDYTNDAFSNIWYGDDQLYAAYGDTHVYAEVDGKAKFVVSFISTPDAEGNVTKYNFALYAGEKPSDPTALDNISIEGKVVKTIINGQLIIIKDGVQYNAQGQVIK